MFESARSKLARAEHHISDLKGQFEGFVKRKPHRFSVKHDEETGQPVVQIRFVESVPDTFAVVIGDAVHNLRCALDHLMWKLIGWDGGTTDKHLQFPCREGKIDFEAACNGIQTPSIWIKDMLRRFECHVGGTGEGLYVLHALDNADKHRAIAPVLRATTHPPLRVLDANGDVIIVLTGNKFIQMSGETGTMPLMRIPPGAHVELDEDASCTPSIFLRDLNPMSGDAFDVLGRFAGLVKVVLATVKSEIAKNPKKP
jgi:hypothetical protein